MAILFPMTVLRSTAVVIIISVLIMFNIEKSSARSLELKDGYLSSVDDINKRNSWWSKKSNRGYQKSGMQEPLYDEAAIDRTTNIDRTTDRDNLRAYSLVFDCYIKDCVAEFVQCVQRSTMPDKVAACKRRHELCGRMCKTIWIQDTLM